MSRVNLLSISTSWKAAHVIPLDSYQTRKSSKQSLSRFLLIHAFLVFEDLTSLVRILTPSNANWTSTVPSRNRWSRRTPYWRAFRSWWSWSSSRWPDPAKPARPVPGPKPIWRRGLTRWPLDGARWSAGYNGGTSSCKALCWSGVVLRIWRASSWIGLKARRNSRRACPARRPSKNWRRVHGDFGCCFLGMLCIGRRRLWND